MSEKLSLPTAYDAKAQDEKWIHFWEKNGLFLANASSSKPAYCIVIPPPNVTGVLHMGHALVNTLQDILIRWKRMSGFETLWVPGTDHAGIATQTVVERALMNGTGKKRTDFTREEFLKEVWKWKENSHKIIVKQLKKIGASCDWTRERFTMDAHNNRAVRVIFKMLFEQGLIYRGNYLVNWDPLTQTALADDEVEHEERNSFLWHIKYPLEDGSGFAICATTRPETMLGDTAIAVSQKDERYTHLIGKKVTVPLVGRLIPIIQDHRIDPEFGTGMVKITPAHDPNDYQIGLTHQLEFINIMTPDGKINENGGEFSGLEMKEARERVVQRLKGENLLEKTEPHVHRVGISYRSKATIEPYLSKQWFVKMDSFKDKLREFVKGGQVKLIPPSWESVYFHWIDNLRDWCISRQLWWGHRIPVWYSTKDPEKVIVWDGDAPPSEALKNPEEWVQDGDVLDTWFSSALWPFATLGWPDITPDLKKFYPNSVLVTGYDILFFWVARMLFMGEYATGKVPFPETFLHGLIYGKSYWRENPTGGITYITGKEREEYDLGKSPPSDVKTRWEKLSKSKGNIIDPLEIIEKYGTDAMRMGLAASSPQGREIDLDRRRFEEFKNFTNKIWNGARFVLMNLRKGEDKAITELTFQEFKEGLDESLFSLEDRWILSSLIRTTNKVTAALENYQFDIAANASYDFFWKEFCAYWVELSKPALFGKLRESRFRKNKQKLATIILLSSIRLLHPMAPFITEELFHLLKEHFGNITDAQADPYTKEAILALLSKACCVAPFPTVIRAKDLDERVEATFQLMERAIYTLRNIRGEMKLPPGALVDIHIAGSPSDPIFMKLKQHKEMIEALIRTKSITFHTEDPQLKAASTGVIESVKLMIPLSEEMLEKERLRLSKEIERLEETKSRIEKQLSNQDFISKAPQELVQKQKDLLLQTETELKEIRQKI